MLSDNYIGMGHVELMDEIDPVANLSKPVMKEGFHEIIQALSASQHIGKDQWYAVSIKGKEAEESFFFFTVPPNIPRRANLLDIRYCD